MANQALGNNGGRLYSYASQPSLINCDFIVDSTNGNGLGIRSLQGQGVANVYMNTQNSSLANQLNLLTARSYAVLGASTVTSSDGSAGTILTGNLGLYPGTSITGFPPATVSGATNVANVASQQAQAAALAAYTAGQAMSASTIASELGTQSLTPGVYKAASGAMTLNGVLTLTGNGVYIFQTTTTFISGGSSAPSIVLAGGALASNVYFLVGSSATLNSSNAGSLNANVIANTSITVTDAGTVNGSLIALNGAVTLTGATAVNAQPLAASVVGGPSNPAPGYAWIQLANNYNRYLGGFSGFVSPTSGGTLAINSTALTVGNPYIIASVGNAAAGQATIAPVADVSGSLASKYFIVYDSYGNTFVIYFVVSGVGSAPLLGSAAPQGSVGLHYVQQSILSGSSAATIGAALVLTLENLPSGIAGVNSFTASGTSTVTIINTSTVQYHLPGVPVDGAGALATGFTLALTVDDHNTKDWMGVGLPAGVVPAVGASFIAKASGSGLSSGLVIAPGVSGINSVEVIGNANVSIGPIPQGGSANVGGWILVQLLSNGVPTAPVNGSVVGLSFYMDERNSPSNNNSRNP